ncbi:DUF5715 family protein [Roseisolibacter agri]|uniref:LysM domain-containing protein n=1 Tax=Roseisolibacter agri TaxID=2014610 RepID=A0AA37Q5G9_9BACT|nr:DUF5715 family protein [Roseisolibacter agri]GLC26944.1 hypothetical protein rosag_34570 [Roseisolibacter agri]
MRLPLAHGLPFRLALALAALTVGAAAARAQSLRGSPESVDRMYQEAQREALAFHETPDAVRTAVDAGALVRLTTGRDVTLRRVAFPYVTPATEAFVLALGRQHRAACGTPLMVTSAARPTTRQPRNSVAQSVHPTGMAIDLHKPRGRCLRWLRATLLELEDAGVLEATEEFRPPHFHVAVYPTAYTRYAAAQPPAASSPSSTVALQSLATVATAPRPQTRAKPSAKAAAKPRASTRSSTRVASAAPRATQRYRVRAGDTLWDIARARGLTVKQILAANGMSRAVIRPGQRIVLPSARARQLSSADAVGQ